MFTPLAPTLLSKNITRSSTPSDRDAHIPISRRI